MGRPYQGSWPEWLLKLGKDGMVSFRIENDERFVFIKAKVSVTDNKWRNIAVVRDRNIHKLKIYVDGELSHEIIDDVQGSLAKQEKIIILKERWTLSGPLPG